MKVAAMSEGPQDPKAVKSELRRRFHQAREEIPASDRVRAAATCTERLFNSPPLSHCRTLLLYAAFGAEMATAGMFRAAAARGIRVAYPRLEVAQRAIVPVVADDLGDLNPGAFGILEPTKGEVLRPADLDIIIVPALALTESGKRLGYGGGYYDRFLARAGNAVPIGVTYDAFVVADLPDEPHDQRVRWIVTERRARQVERVGGGS